MRRGLFLMMESAMNDSIASAVSCKMGVYVCVFVCVSYLYYGPRRESLLSKVPDTPSLERSMIVKHSPFHYSHNSRNSIHTAIAGYAIMS